MGTVVLTLSDAQEALMSSFLSLKNNWRSQIKNAFQGCELLQQWGAWPGEQGIQLFSVGHHGETQLQGQERR